MVALTMAPLDSTIVATWQALDNLPTQWRAYSVPGGRPFRAGQRSPGLLTNTSKMPCPSWSLPAGKACPGAAYGAGSICGSCYAQKGQYAQGIVKHAQSERFTWTRTLMRTPEGRGAFVAYMSAAIAATRLPYFRVHDSGDLYSAAYADCWRRIAVRLSHVRFWFPTRSYRIATILPAIQELASLPNVTVRPSALMLDEAPPIVEGLQAGLGATHAKSAATCVAYRQDGQCRDCRACWDRPAVAITYPLH